MAAVQNGKTLSVAQTDAAGRFTLANMSGGVYELQTASNTDVYRLWAPRTAPPAAQDSVLLVNDQNVVLGQQRNGGSGLARQSMGPGRYRGRRDRHSVGGGK